MLNSWETYFVEEEKLILKNRLTKSFIKALQAHILEKYLKQLRLGAELEVRINSWRAQNQIPDIEKYILGFVLLSISGDDTNFPRTLLTLPLNEDPISVAMTYRAAMIMRLSIERDIFIANQVPESLIRIANATLQTHKQMPYMDLGILTSQARTDIEVASIFSDEITHNPTLTDAKNHYLQQNGVEIFPASQLPIQILEILRNAQPNDE